MSEPGKALASASERVGFAFAILILGRFPPVLPFKKRLPKHERKQVLTGAARLCTWLQERRVSHIVTLTEMERFFYNKSSGRLGELTL